MNNLGILDFPDMIQKSFVNIRSIDIEQAENKIFDNFEKGFIGEDEFNACLDILEKARSGIYKDTAKNRKLNRVGARYGKGKEENIGDEKKSGKNLSSEELSDFAKKTPIDVLKRHQNDNTEMGNEARKEIKKREDSSSNDKVKPTPEPKTTDRGESKEDVDDVTEESISKHAKDVNKLSDKELSDLLFTSKTPGKPKSLRVAASMELDKRDSGETYRNKLHEKPVAPGEKVSAERAEWQRKFAGTEKKKEESTEEKFTKHWSEKIQKMNPKEIGEKLDKLGVRNSEKYQKIFDNTKDANKVARQLYKDRKE